MRDCFVINDFPSETYYFTPTPLPMGEERVRVCHSERSEESRS